MLESTAKRLRAEVPPEYMVGGSEATIPIYSGDNSTRLLFAVKSCFHLGGIGR